MASNALKVTLWCCKIVLLVPNFVTPALPLNNYRKSPFKAVKMDRKCVRKRPKKVSSRESLFHHARDFEHCIMCDTFYCACDYYRMKIFILASFFQKPHVKTSYGIPDMINLLDNHQDINYAKNCSFLHNFFPISLFCLLLRLLRFLHIYLIFNLKFHRIHHK